MDNAPWQQAQEILEILSALSYRTGNLATYLRTIAVGVSELIKVDWTVVTLCEDGLETVLASSVDLSEEDSQVYALHGRLTGTVVQLGRTLIVENTQDHPEYGRPPQGYQSYLGIPLRTPQGQIIGTICSFHRQSRSYSAEVVRLVEMFAERAATVLDNYRLWQKEQQFHQDLEQEVALRTQQLHTAQAELVERERLAAMGEFAAMIVHEVRNPLTTIWGVLQRLQRIIPPTSQEYLTLALDESERLEKLLRQILLYAKPQVLQLQGLELNPFSRTLLSQLRSLPVAQERTVILVSSSVPVWVQADPDKLQQVFINIFTNACEAVAAGETITWTVSSTSEKALVQVHNGGPPVPAEVLPRLTEPFYTTKATGVGLGLALVQRIMTAHGGELMIHSTNTGTTVTLTLPHSVPA
ncbi:GAF domain-containing sensor histidine kinase [Candidatus Cyanaurora vandensis]|uniref:GAF domain-containing sensor histidine kinase n=1 Tax=Candidatus Cyanaurora vandensis TaxID=2714958 RepID=UPI00257D48C9|nr:GAF domain-containing sensor histidine kinase [Candidatus Cyanaurora vandensis]